MSKTNKFDLPKTSNYKGLPTDQFLGNKPHKPLRTEVTILLLFIPILLSLLMKWITILYNMYVLLVPLWQVLFIIFWFYVGSRVALLKWKSWVSFLLGNSLWFISITLHIIQSFILKKAFSGAVAETITYGYITMFIKASTTFLSVFGKGFDSNLIIIFSYLIMLGTFTVGFMFQRKRKNSGSIFNIQFF